MNPTTYSKMKRKGNTGFAAARNEAIERRNQENQGGKIIVVTYNKIGDILNKTGEKRFYSKQKAEEFKNKVANEFSIYRRIFVQE